MYEMAFIIEGDIPFELPDKFRTFRSRTNDRHLTPHYIPQLRQFVDTRPSEETSYTGDTWIFFFRPARYSIAFSLKIHCPKFDCSKWLPEQSGSLLEKERRSFRIQPDGQHNQRNERQSHRQQGYCQYNINGSLHKFIQTLIARREILQKPEVADISNRNFA